MFISLNFSLFAPSALADSALLKSLNNEISADTQGQGQFDKLIIRGAYLIDGTGAPPTGPVDVVIVKDRIKEIRSVGSPGIEIDEKKRPRLGDGNVKEIDAHGKYLLPGFVDSHSHIHSLKSQQGVSPEYIFKLWLGTWRNQYS